MCLVFIVLLTVTTTTEIDTNRHALSLHDALPLSARREAARPGLRRPSRAAPRRPHPPPRKSPPRLEARPPRAVRRARARPRNPPAVEARPAAAERASLQKEK